MKAKQIDVGKFTDTVVLVSKTATPDEYGGFTESLTEIVKPCYIAKKAVKEAYDNEQKRFVYATHVLIVIRDEGLSFDSFKLDDIEYRVLNISQLNRTMLEVEGVSYAT